MSTISEVSRTKAWALHLLGPLFLCGSGCSGNSTMDEPSSLICDQQELGELYKRRIEPLLADDRPKSCNECHLSGVDLGSFVRGDACQTMACLVEKDLVDLNGPEESTILQWIARATPGSELITEEVIQAEFDGFLEWIQWSSSCGGEVCPSFDNPCEGGASQLDCAATEDHEGKPPFIDPGDCSALTREAVFREKVFAWRGRCSSCHFAGSNMPMNEAPIWIAAGPCNQASLETMRTVIAEYVDLENPAQSLLLTKPLVEELGGVGHGGGPKFHDLEDAAYVDFLYWITREQECKGD